MWLRGPQVIHSDPGSALARVEEEGMTGEEEERQKVGVRIGKWLNER